MAVAKDKLQEGEVYSIKEGTTVYLTSTSKDGRVTSGVTETVRCQFNAITGTYKDQTIWVAAQTLLKFAEHVER